MLTGVMLRPFRCGRSRRLSFGASGVEEILFEHRPRLIGNCQSVAPIRKTVAQIVTQNAASASGECLRQFTFAPPRGRPQDFQVSISCSQSAFAYFFVDAQDEQHTA